MEHDDLGLDSAHQAVAVVGISALLPDAPDVSTFWQNVLSGRNSITEVPHDRWNPADYWDPNPSAPDKTYSKIGAFVRGFKFDSLRYRIPPRVAASMDQTQQWMLCCARDALVDAGWPENGKFDPARVAVIFGNALGGELHELTSMRALLPEAVNALKAVPEFQALPENIRAALASGMLINAGKRLPPITEDSMPGELGNCIAGRVTNVLDLGGTNYTADAACASSLAALQGAINLLALGQADAVVTGGVDRSMAPPTYVKFSKIGALSPDGSRPFDAGANGFVMGEGCVAMVLRRLADAERDQNRIYAVIRAVGGSSDGKGKGITAPNPQGQVAAIRNAYQIAKFSPMSIGLIEAHGTSTRVGDTIEAESLARVFADSGLPARSVALGSIKSQIGHLKSGAGAVGLLKAALSLHHKVLPPTINVREPNPAIPFDRVPFFLCTEAQPWEQRSTNPRRAGVSSFGFGGTNFHVLLEEHVPGVLTRQRKPQITVSDNIIVPTLKPTLCLGAADADSLRQRLGQVLESVKQGRTPETGRSRRQELAERQRMVINYSDAADLMDKGQKALQAIGTTDLRVLKALRLKSIFYGTNAKPKVAALFPGQGSQYVGMLKALRQTEPEVRETFAEADEIMANKLPRRLSEYVFDEGDPVAADLALRDTTVCQPAVLAADLSLLKMLKRYGISPDMVMGHSLGEYAALVASGAMPFADALLAVSARAKEMASVSIADCGRMASVFAPEEKVREVLTQAEGYVVAANINSHNQTVIGGSTQAVEQAAKRFEAMGIKAVFLPVSHAFHTEIVAPASKPLRQVLSRLNLKVPEVPIISNVSGEPYPTGPGAREKMLDLLARQIAAPVQFVRGLETLYSMGARVFVEVGPKKVLASFAEDVLAQHNDVLALFTNHPKKGDIESFSEALSSFFAAGLGGQAEQSASSVAVASLAAEPVASQTASISRPYEISTMSTKPSIPAPIAASPTVSANDSGYIELGKTFANFLASGLKTYQKHFGDGAMAASVGAPASVPTPAASIAAATNGSVVISGVGLGLPGVNHQVFGDDNVQRILAGETLIDSISQGQQQRLVDKHVVRLVKSADGSGKFEDITDTAEVLHLAGQRGEFDLGKEFGIAGDRLEAFDITTKLAVAAAITALRDAGIPLVRRYKPTSKGTWLPDNWVLPESMADETGVIFASAFAGQTSLISEVDHYWADRARHEKLAELKALRQSVSDGAAIDERIRSLEAQIEQHRYHFNRKFLFKVLAMGHSQLAELIGARGPNTQINVACASAATAVGVAEDWIRLGRCRRVIVVTADDTTSTEALPWYGAGFLASGAASTESDVTKAALPFDRRRHGLILGMGASGLVLESEDAVRERGMRGIAEVLGVEYANSAFHGSRLDVNHISQVMERLVSRVEAQRNLDRREIAHQTVFVSHETYTPARGGSASAEIFSLRHVFKDRASQLVVANTKGMTGHPMGAGIEEAVAVKILQTGTVPPVPNLKEPDPELGDLRMSQGGQYPVRYALRLGAGFGSQIVVALFQKIPKDRVANASVYQRWLEEQSGRPQASTEVVNKTLRVRDDGPPMNAAPKSTWTRGMGPMLRAEVDESSAPSASPSLSVASVAPTASKPAAAASAPAPAATASATQNVSSAATASNAINQRVLDMVSAKTGYPRDMLALDLDLEADLGIDTVKQAEIFAEIRAAYELPRRDDLKLRDYPTLNHIIDLVRQARPDLADQAQAAPNAAGSSAPAQSAAATAGPSSAASQVADRILDLVSAKTGYPRDMLAMDLDLEADLGIDTVKQAEIFAEVRQVFDLPRRDDLKLRDYPTLGHIIQFVGQMRPELMASGASNAVSAVNSAPQAGQVNTVTNQAAASASATSGADLKNPLTEKLLQIVASKTGYPQDMLALDLDLEADLGIDTVKQAEIFAQVRQEFELPRRDDLKLRDYPTLGHMIQLVHAGRPDLITAVPAAPATNAASVTTAAAAPAVASASASSASDPVADRILELVAEKTGYPRDMLAMDLDLEADLGIDTVKQAEIFAQIRENFALPRRDDIKLRDFPTLNHLIGLVKGAKSETASPPAPAADEAASEAQVAAGTNSAATSLRRVPVPVVRPDLKMCKPTAVQLAAGKRVVIVPDAGKVAKQLAEQLAAQGVEVLTLDAGPVDKQIKAWLAAGTVDGVYHLASLDAEPDIVSAKLEALQAALEERVKRFCQLSRGLLPMLQRSQAFLISATRMGGLHGYGQEPTAMPVAGAVSGFTKAFGRECPETLVKVVDFAGAAKPAEIASTLVAETLRDAAVMEVGYAYGTRHSIGLGFVEVAPPNNDGLQLGADSVFLVTGAGGGITSAIVRDLASASKGTFYLLDLAPLPDANNPDLAKLANRDQLRRDIFEKLKESTGKRVTPAQVETVLAGLDRDAAVLAAVRGVEQAGAKVHYRSVNVCDAAAMATVIDEIRKNHGRIDAVLHAAGKERSRMLADKPQEEFDSVFDAKVLGMRNILCAAPDMPIKAMICFSSIAGRFGNAGQTDYSSANDFLCKTMLAMPRYRPQTRGLAIDWTAWGGAGMATRGSIPEMMRRAGIDMLDLKEGVPLVRQELLAGSRGEVVMARSLGLLMKSPDEAGGLDLQSIAKRLESEQHPMVGRVLGMDLYRGLQIETVLDPTSEPFLRDHEIDGVPVLPGVMGLEGFAEVARLLLPDHRVRSIENVRFEAPFKYYRRQPRPGIFCAKLRREDADNVVAEITLSSSRTLASGEQTESRHFSGTVRLTRAAFEKVMAKKAGKGKSNGQQPVSNDDIYRIYFHGPAYQVLDKVEIGNQAVRSQFKANLPPELARSGVTTVIGPRLIEMCFQAAGIWEIATTGRMALPAAIDKLVSHGVPHESATLRAEVTPRREGDELCFDARVMDQDGRVYLELAGYRTSIIPSGLPEELLQPLRKAVSGVKA